MDPKHQFAAQYVLSRAANERREREALLAAAVNMSHFAMTSANLQPVLGSSGAGPIGTHASTLTGSPTGEGMNTDSSTRISTPADMKLEHSSNIRPLYEVHQVSYPSESIFVILKRLRSSKYGLKLNFYYNLCT